VDTLNLFEEVSAMGKIHKPYPEEFRRQMVELVRAGRNPYELAREFEPSAEAIRSWVRQADRDEGRSRPDASLPTTAEREELARLRRENKQLRLERDILAKATAWFARETGTIRSGSSDS
jgi:transposase